MVSCLCTTITKGFLLHSTGSGRCRLQVHMGRHIRDNSSSSHCTVFVKNLDLNLVLWVCVSQLQRVFCFILLQVWRMQITGYLGGHECTWATVSDLPVFNNLNLVLALRQHVPQLQGFLLNRSPGHSRCLLQVHLGQCGGKRVTIRPRNLQQLGLLFSTHSPSTITKAYTPQFFSA